MVNKMISTGAGSFSRLAGSLINRNISFDIMKTIDKDLLQYFFRDRSYTDIEQVLMHEKRWRTIKLALWTCFGLLFLVVAMVVMRRLGITNHNEMMLKIAGVLEYSLPLLAVSAPIVSVMYVMFLGRSTDTHDDWKKLRRAIKELVKLFGKSKRGWTRDKLISALIRKASQKMAATSQDEVYELGDVFEGMHRIANQFARIPNHPQIYEAAARANRKHKK